MGKGGGTSRDLEDEGDRPKGQGEAIWGLGTASLSS